MKKVIGIIMTICMFASLIPAGSVKIKAEMTIMHSGKSGDLDWSIDSEGLLTITGVGDYLTEPYDESEAYSQEPVWCNYRDEIKSAKVKVSGITSTMNMFRGCAHLTEIDLSNLDTSNVTNMVWMFYECSALTKLDLSNFDTRNVEDMSTMFSGCSSLKELDLSNFNTSNVKDMIWMFNHCSNLKKLDLSSFNTAKVANMQSMFTDCCGLTELDLSNFDTGNVTSMMWMFSGCSSLNSLDLSNFNTGKVENMCYMFTDCSSLAELDLRGFDTRNVGTMEWMFYGCSALTKLDLSNFDTRNVENMSSMFEGCSHLSFIHTPKNVNCYAELPEGTWKDSNGTVYTELPQGISYSVELSKTEPEESVWNSYFGSDVDWYEGAEGSLTRGSDTGWRADLSSVGWGGVYGAQVFKEIKIQKNKQYMLHFKLQSTDVDKYVYITISDEQGENVPAFSDWVYLPAGEEIESSITFTAREAANRIIFAFGGDFGDRAGAFSDPDAEYRYSLLGPDYQELLANDANGDPSAATSIICSDFSIQGAENETTEKPEEPTTKKPLEKESSNQSVENPTRQNVHPIKTEVPAPKKAGVKKVIRGKKRASLTIKKVKGAKGYLIQYSMNRKFKKAKNKYTTKLKVTIKKLKSKKTYYFRIKAYKLEGKKKILSKKWSAVKKVKIK